jgi:type IV pilus assembly protein PilC
METIRSGEESGDLIKSFERLSNYYERMNKTREKATSAMIYPAFVIVVAIVVVAIIMLRAVPSFTSTFSAMGIELPLVTRVLIAVSNFMVKYIWVIVGILAALILAVRVYGHTDQGSEKLARLKLAIPLIGDVNLMEGASQFAHTMTTMLASGMNIIQALDVSARSVSNLCIAREIQSTVSGVEAGHSLGECMAQCEMLPDMLKQMTAVGESTGSLEFTLDVLAEYYDNEVDVKTARALSVLEPTIIIVLAAFVVVILMAVYLPMFSLYDAI